MRGLWAFYVEDIMKHYPHIKALSYHLYYIGTPGLIEWKRSVGLRPYVYKVERTEAYNE